MTALNSNIQCIIEMNQKTAIPHQHGEQPFQVIVPNIMFVCVDSVAVDQPSVWVAQLLQYWIHCIHACIHCHIRGCGSGIPT
jgi:hypothetical protein